MLLIVEFEFSIRTNLVRIEAALAGLISMRAG